LKNILLKIEYDGTLYKGWQIQPRVATVEETIKSVLQQICQSKIQIKASSRTDSGVHARGQVATVKVPDHIPLKKLVFSLNSLLPNDISISNAAEVPLEFSARYGNKGKRYIYQVLNSPFAKALNFGFYHWIRAPLDIARIRQASHIFEGTHDFSAFRGKGCQQLSMTKTIHQISIVENVKVDHRTIYFTVEGNSFLRNMVRIMVGTLIDIGRGRLETETVQHALTSGRREEVGLTAPAKGLTLDEVFFDQDPFAGNQPYDWH
jgi:tRNA pseudouridine38-40 synthase